VIFQVLFTSLNQKHSHWRTLYLWALPWPLFPFHESVDERAVTWGLLLQLSGTKRQARVPPLSTMHFASCFSQSPPSSTCSRLLIYGGLRLPSLPTRSYRSFIPSLCLSVPLLSPKCGTRTGTYFCFLKVPKFQFKSLRLNATSLGISVRTLQPLIISD